MFKLHFKSCQFFFNIVPIYPVCFCIVNIFCVYILYFHQLYMKFSWASQLHQPLILYVFFFPFLFAFLLGMQCYFIAVFKFQFNSITQSCLTLCDRMNCSMPGLPVHHQPLESTQTHVHQVCDAIQPSHPLSSPSPPALNLSQHQGLFK